MKKTTVTLTFILAFLFSAVSGICLIKEGRANPFPMTGIEITLKNPQNITYNDNTIPVFLGQHKYIYVLEQASLIV
jgi:hypothetical protein